MAKDSSSRLRCVTTPKKTAVSEFFTYSTVRSATIKSVRVGIIYRVAQLAILFYIIG
jgi:hypothetical protein